MNIDFRKLIKPALRFNPEWIIVSETRGKEAFDMLNAAATGHNIITTLHAKSAFNIPTRVLNMCLEGSNNISEHIILNNIFETLDFGIHLQTYFEDNKIKREIVEIVEYENSNGDHKINLIYSKNDGFSTSNLSIFNQEKLR